MAVSTTLVRKQYDGDGISTVFATDFLFLASSHLEVILTASTGIETLQTLGVHYSVTGAGLAGGGDVIFITPPPPLTRVTISRQTPRTQETDFEANGNLASDAIEGNDDKLTLIVQEAYDYVDAISGFSRVLQYPTTEPETTNNKVPNKETRADNFFYWNADGEPTVAASMTGAVLLDEPTLASNDPINGATQASIKAYVDNVNTTITNLVAQVQSLAAKAQNKLLNSNFNINQRNYTSGTPTSGANQYTLDRWRVIVSGEAVTWVDSGGVRTVGAPVGGVEQIIEGVNLLAGDYCVNWDGSATCTVDDIAITKNEVVTIAGGSNVSLKFFSGTVSKVRFVPGDNADLYDFRNVTEEQNLCMRYYQQGYNLEEQAVASAGFLQGGVSLYLPIQMRVTPTPIGQNTSASLGIDPLGVSYSTRSISIGYQQLLSATPGDPVKASLAVSGLDAEIN